MTDDATTIRPARADEASGSAAVAGRVLERAGTVRAVAVLEESGTAATPDEPVIRLLRAADDADLDRDVAPLLADLADHAERRTGAARVLIAWDAMDTRGLRMLAGLGFRPTGTQPYFEHGGGPVEYVAGYRDPVGSVVDLARTR